MRKIKFRAWDESGKQMAYWQLHQNPNVETDISYMWVGDNGFCYCWEHPDLIKEQFTGLLDKNGVEIYEGDIVPLKITFQVDSFKDCSYINTDSEGNKTYKKVALVNSTVCFEDGGMVFKYKDIVKELWIAKVDRKMWEVIGNIHENK